MIVVVALETLDADDGAHERDTASELSYALLLTQAGFDVTAVEDSAAALKHFEISLFDLAILDVALGHDKEAGFHLCTEIRKRSETLPIIFLTALDSELDKISGMRLSADDILQKM